MDKALENFNQQVANTPVVQSLREGQVEIQRTLNEEIKSNNKRFGKLEDKVDSLEVEMKSGFNRLAESLESLRDEIKDEKLQKVQDAYDTLIEEKKQTNNNKDKIQIGSIIALVPTLAYFVLDKFGVIVGG